MKLNEYQKLAMRTSNRELTNRDHIINGALGLCGESGEVADQIKKCYMQGHAIDRAKIAEEIGDVLWYCAELSAWLDIELDEIAERNIAKLMMRYPDGFDAEKSVNREE